MPQLYSRRILLVGTTAALSACTTVGPDYRPEPLEASQAAWSSGTLDARTTSASADPRWWRMFADPMLDTLISRAERQNLTLAQAAARLREARALRRIAGAADAPQVDVNTRVTQTRRSENGLLPIDRIPGAERDNTLYAGGFDAAWELDLFGGTRRRIEAADARSGAAAADQRAATLSLRAEVARDYLELRGIQRRTDVARETVTLQRRTLELVTEQRAAGVADGFDIERAQAQVLTTEASLPALEADERAAMHRLAVLVGEPPETLLNELSQATPLPPLPDLVPVGLRSDLLRRRPDIAAAERRLAAATADVGVTTAHLYPSFALVGSGGLEATALSSLFEAASTLWSFGPRLVWRAFDGGRTRAEIEVARARVEGARAAYRETVLTALGDAETALVRYGRQRRATERLEAAAASTRRAAELARLRFEAGEEDLLSVIDAERELARITDDLAQARTRSATTLVALFKSLGGGWEDADPPSTADAPAPTN